MKSGEAVKKADLLFKYNSATYVEVIIAQSNKLQAELDFVDIQLKNADSQVLLYKALGGGIN